MAERRGFEPPIPCGIHAFQACTLDLSDTSPQQSIAYFNIFLKKMQANSSLKQKYFNLKFIKSMYKIFFMLYNIRVSSLHIISCVFLGGVI